MVEGKARGSPPCLAVSASTHRTLTLPRHALQEAAPGHAGGHHHTELAVGFRGANAGVGIDRPSDPNAVRETMIHELGHNMRLAHAPCGGPSSSDPNYPYANAQLQVPGVQVFNCNAATVDEALQELLAGRLTAAENSDVEGHW